MILQALKNMYPKASEKVIRAVMKELLSYMARHHEDLEKSSTDEQKEIFS